MQINQYFKNLNKEDIKYRLNFKVYCEWREFVKLI